LEAAILATKAQKQIQSTDSIAVMILLAIAPSPLGYYCQHALLTTNSVH